MTNTVNNDKISLNRKEGNVGAFSELQEKMSRKTVRNIAKEFNVKTKGLTISVDKNEELLRLPFAGSANANKIGEITFFPNAFKDKETLVRTLFHERIHVEQYKEYGAEFVSANAARFEREAYEAEEQFIIELKKKGEL